MSCAPEARRSTSNPSVLLSPLTLPNSSFFTSLISNLRPQDGQWRKNVLNSDTTAQIRIESLKDMHSFRDSMEAFKSPSPRGSIVPRELKSKEEFAKLLVEAVEIRVVKRGDDAKVKLRTPDGLFTLKTSSDDVSSLTKGSKAPVVEL